MGFLRYQPAAVVDRTATARFCARDTAAVGRRLCWHDFDKYRLIHREKTYGNGQNRTNKRDNRCSNNCVSRFTGTTNYISGLEVHLRDKEFPTSIGQTSYTVNNTNRSPSRCFGCFRTSHRTSEVCRQKMCKRTRSSIIDHRSSAQNKKSAGTDGS